MTLSSLLNFFLINNDGSIVFWFPGKICLVKAFVLTAVSLHMES